MKAANEIVVWDWNGTIVADVEHAVRILNRMLAKRALPSVDIEMHRDAFGAPLIEYYRELGFDFGTDSFESLCEEFATLYQESFSRCELRQGVLEVLKRFKGLGIAQYLLSSSEERQIVNHVSHHKLSHYFSAIKGRTDRLAGGKMEMARELLSACDGSKAIFIGDLVQDYEMAMAFGARCVLVADGHHSHERLALCKGALIVPSFEALAEKIGDDSTGPLFR